jgi:hypothetical protein
MVISNPNRATSPQVISIPSNSSLSYLQNASNSHKLFSENFWGEKINGFEVLCSNLKHSLTNVKELEIFLRECANCEDTYGKILNKLIVQANKYSANGTFNPLWSPLKEINERYAASHIQLFHQLQELIKEIQRYNDDLSKKIKKIRENETQTQNAVQSFQEIHQNLNKAKDQYHNLCIEFEKQKRQLDPQQITQYQILSQQQSSSNLISSAGVQNNINNLQSNQSNLSQGNQINGPSSQLANINNQSNIINSSVSSSNANSGTSASDRLSSLATSITANKVSQVQKLEKKMKQSLEDYKSTIEKYNLIRVDFERKLADSCNHFQYAEETHLKQMRSFVESYSKLLSQINANKQQIYNEFNLKISEHFTVDYLIQLFIENKRTGIDRPESAQFIEQLDYAKLNNNNNNQSNQQTLNEADFNLIISNNNNNQHQTLASSLSVGMLPISLSNQNYSQTNLQIKNDSIDGKGGDFSIFSTNNSTVNNLNNNNNNNTNSRGTPVFFSTSNLIGGSNSNYSQLTNAASTTTLNTIQSMNSTNTININGSSPIHLKESSTVSPLNASSSTSNSDTTATSNTNVTTNSKKNDSKGLNIFNVDFLGRNKNKEKKAAQKAAAAAAAAATASENKDTILSKSKFSRNKKNKQTSSSSYSTTSTTAADSNNLINLNINKDTSSLNSEDSSDTHQRTVLADQSTIKSSPASIIKSSNQQTINADQQLVNQLTSTNTSNGGGSITARSISSITGSLSFDLLDQLKISSNGHASDIDSEGFSIRPDSSIDLRRKNLNNNDKNRDDGDMNNLYGSSTDSDSDDSDSDNGDSMGGPVKVMLKIKPKSDITDDDEKKMKNNTDVLREISKNLQLKPPGPANTTNSTSRTKLTNKRTYYYNYGTANPDKATSGYSTTVSNLLDNDSNIKNDSSSINNMTRSISVGSVVNSNISYSVDLFSEFNRTTPSNSTNKNNSFNVTNNKNTTSLLDLDLNFEIPNNSSTSNNLNNVSIKIGPPLPPTLPTSMSLSKVSENTNLYNIDEDKEVESSFHHNLMKKANTTTSVSTSVVAASSPSTIQSSSNNGRFTPACFPGRTTPDFRHTASFFEQQGTRASIISPLTINGGSEIIPIAVAFNETIHAYFKIGDQSKFKVKCFGCMKISFPFAILKLLAIEIPQLEFRLNNLQIVNQDLKLNTKLLIRKLTQPSVDPFLPSSSSSISPVPSNDSNLEFSFITQNLITELKQQHQQNKLAAFFNFELLKYEFKYTTIPLVLNADWSNNSTESTIELNLDYLFKFKKQLSQVNFMIVMPSQDINTIPSSTIKLKLIKSEPPALVQENDNKLHILWQMSNINSDGHITAKFLVLNQPTATSNNDEHNSQQIIPIDSNILEKYYQPIYTKFHIDNQTLSQVKFDILSTNYKLSLLKERIETGKYFCNCDQPQQQQSQIASTVNESSNNQSNNSQKKQPPFAGSLSTTVGSTVDLLNY